MSFGTGAVNIAPAHDFNDYVVGRRHGLEMINLLNDDGAYNHNAGPEFQGMKRSGARSRFLLGSVINFLKMMIRLMPYLN